MKDYLAFIRRQKRSSHICPFKRQNHVAPASTVLFLSSHTVSAFCGFNSLPIVSIQESCGEFLPSILACSPFTNEVLNAISILIYLFSAETIYKSEQRRKQLLNQA